MEINVHTSDITLSPHQREALDASLARAVKAHDRHIQDVSVNLQDLNRHKGGIDKRCKIIARLHWGQSIVVEETEAEIVDAVRKGSQGLEEALRRAVEKKRDHRR